MVRQTCWQYVSESDILGPIDYFSDIEHLVSYEWAILADYSSRNKMKIFPLFIFFHVFITTLKYMHKASRTVFMTNIRVLHFYEYIFGQFHQIFLKRYDILTS